jgi:hypothetical protein
MVSLRWLTVLGSLCLILTGCGDSGAPALSTPATPTTATSTAASGPDAFLADLARVGFGLKDATDTAFIDVGNSACRGLAQGISFGHQVQVFLRSDAKPTRQQAETLVRSAVKNLCPEQSSMLLPD